MGKTTEAEKLLADALKRNPKDAEALLQRSQLWLRSGDLVAAERDLNQVMRFQPESAQAHFEVAKIRRIQGLVASERQELTEALSRNPEFLPARLALARNYTVDDKAKLALGVLKQTPDGQKHILDVSVERNWALIGIGNLSEARQGIDRGLAIRRVPAFILQDGFLKMKQKDFISARAASDGSFESGSGKRDGVSPAFR